MGGLLWWEDQIILGCYNLRDLRDEVSVILLLFIYFWLQYHLIYFLYSNTIKSGVYLLITYLLPN